MSGPGSFSHASGASQITYQYVSKPKQYETPSANQPQCQRDTAVPDGPCQRCIRVHAYQQQPTRTSVPPAVPYVGCFRYRKDALRFFCTSTQPALQAGWGHTLAVNISVPTFGSVGNVSICYRHGGPFGLLVQQHVRPGSSAAVLAVYSVEKATASYRAYLESEAEAAMDAAVNESFSGSDQSSEVIANVRRDGQLLSVPPGSRHVARLLLAQPRRAPGHAAKEPDQHGADVLARHQ